MRFQQIELQEPRGAQAVYEIVRYAAGPPTLPLPHFHIPVLLDFNYIGEREMRLPLGGLSHPLRVIGDVPGNPNSYLVRYDVYGRVARPNMATDIEPIEGLDDQPERIPDRRHAYARWAGHGVFLHSQIILGFNRTITATAAAVMVAETIQERRELRKASGLELFNEYYDHALPLPRNSEVPALSIPEQSPSE